LSVHTRHDTAGFIILELYPLLHAEGHAVPYEAVTLRKILWDAGYASESAQIAVRQGSVSAYRLLARQQARALDERKLVNAVEKGWKEISGRTRKIDKWFSSRKSGGDGTSSRLVGEPPEAAKESCEDITPPVAKDGLES